MSLVIQPSLPAQAITTFGGIARLPAAKPIEEHDRRCADVGSTKSARILDTATNLFENRVDDASHYTLTTIATLLKLPFACIRLAKKRSRSELIKLRRQ